MFDAMRNSDKEKRTLILYGVIVFICSIAILMTTIISQDKYKNSMDNYEDIIQDEKDMSIRFQSNLKSALDEIKILKEKVQDMETKNQSMETQIDSINNDYLKLEGSLAEATEILQLYKNKEYEACYKLLEQKDSFLNNDTNRELWSSLMKECGDAAAQAYYDSAIIKYGKKKYEDALFDFNKVIYFTNEGPIYNATLSYLIVCYDKTNRKDEFEQLYSFIEENKPELFELPTLSAYK